MIHSNGPPIYSSFTHTNKEICYFKMSFAIYKEISGTIQHVPNYKLYQCKFTERVLVDVTQCIYVKEYIH